MSMSIPGITLSAPLPPAPIAPISSPASTPGVGQTGGAGSADFGSSLSSAMDQLNSLNQNADNLATQVATGTLKNPHDYLIAANEASMTTQVAVAVRNKALEAFNEIMRMQL
jgi:flagellar hook-basal body complex protein FliE